MTQLFLSTYEGDICAYRLKITAEKLVMEQFINSQEAHSPVRALLVLGR